MSHPSRRPERGPAAHRRRLRNLRIEALHALEVRQLLAASSIFGGPVVTSAVDALTPTSVTFVPAPNPTNADLGTIQFTPPATVTGSTVPTAAPFTSVAQLAPSSEFGGDIVQIAAGPGGPFGSGVYAISRGAGDNAADGAVNRPGVIYRVDPATGKATVFFDLNSVINQLEPGATAANSLGAATGLVNWYNISFDPEGYFDGKPSMFVTSVDRTDPNKNTIYQIGPDGSLMGVFVNLTSGASQQQLNINPVSILVPPTQQQQFLRGLIMGAANAAGLGQGLGTPPNAIPPSSSNPLPTDVFPAPGTFEALFFDANAYAPGQTISSMTSFPTGVSATAMDLGPQVGLTSANIRYVDPVYAAFTDFGTPAAGGIPGEPGASGVQGFAGDLLIGNTIITGGAVAGTATTSPTIATIQPADQAPASSTQFRRFYGIAFDQYGFFSQAVTQLTSFRNNVTGNATTAANAISPVANAGNLFVSDLATGAVVTVTPRQDPTTTVAPTPIIVPVQTIGGIVSAAFDPTIQQYVVTVTGGANLGGRIIRITNTGQVTTFAQGFNTSGAQDSSSFANSSLSISFSADGTTLYATDDTGIWQFKTTASLAGSTSGSILGLNDLRSLGVPYDGIDSAVAIVDSGVDGTNPNFRGRVAPGTNVITNGRGDSDNAGLFTGGTATGGTGGGGTGGTGTGSSTVTNLLGEGHGTQVAGVVAQFVPQATILPVNVFYPNNAITPLLSGSSPGSGTTTGGTGGTTGGTAIISNATATPQSVYNGLNYLTKHPFVADPVRPSKVDRVIASTLGFGTVNTFESEGDAYRQYSQIVIGYKNQLLKMRKLGIAPIGAAGQLGAPSLAGTTSGTTGTGGTGGTTTTSSFPFGAANNSQNSNVGDVNGMSLPATLNEVISVSGTYPFPFTTGPNQLPTGPSPVILGQIGGSAPILVGGVGITIGSGLANTGGATAATNSLITQLTAGDTTSAIWAGRLLASDNRSMTTDFTAPEIDIPTFRRGLVTVAGTGTTTSSTTGQSTDLNDSNTFVQGGTSLSAAEVTGAYAMVSSALNYWSQLSANPVTSDAYLTQPVGANTLNFGAHAIRNLGGWNTPDGINAILAWTSIPVTDANDSLSAAGPPTLKGSANFRQFAQISVSNAIAAVEGYEAINYLLDHNDFPIIDANHDNKVTAQELQTFEDNATQMGLPEAGAMARLLGGTDRINQNTITQGLSIPTNNGGANTTAGSNDAPEQPDVLQRRFNFFDYAADGQLNGSIPLSEFQLLSHSLLPSPTAFVITNRQRASTSGFLLDPTAQRNFKDLQHTQLRFALAPANVVRRFRNITPSQFRVNRLGVGDTVTGGGPIFELFNSASNRIQQNTPSTPTPTPSPSPTPTPTPSPTPTPTPAPTPTPTSTTPTSSTSQGSSTTTTGSSTTQTGSSSAQTGGSSTTTGGGSSTQTGSSSTTSQSSGTGTGTGTGTTSSQPFIAGLDPNPTVAQVNAQTQTITGQSTNSASPLSTQPSPAGTLTPTSTDTGTGSTPVSLSDPQPIPTTVATTPPATSSPTSTPTSGPSTTTTSGSSTTKKPRAAAQTSNKSAGQKLLDDLKNIFS
jgi:hypothetical protein